jgi:hypothetical protein
MKRNQRQAGLWLALALILSPALLGSGTEDGEPALIAAARHGEVTLIRALLRAGVDVDAVDANGFTALIAAAHAGRCDVARALLDAGADPGMRHRAYGTALDAAERRGDMHMTRLLRARGARGSGKSVSDLVCVRVWGGQGYCGIVADVEGAHWALRVTRLVGCQSVCAPEACSMGRPVGGGSQGSVDIGADMQVDGACLTHTGLRAEDVL